MQHLIPIIYLSAILFLPVLPAYLLYRLLPSTISVRGPFKGLTLNLTGAFAGYFLLVLISLAFTYESLSPSKPNYEIWKIQGRVQAKAISSRTREEIIDTAGMTIGITPPSYSIGSKGDFAMTVIVVPGHVEGKRQFPTLVFNRPGYSGVVLSLDATNTADIDVDEKMKILRIKNLITMDKLQEEMEKPVWIR